ncbi:hypothetical protein BRARA_G03380 [Brassica rapa]|uniref:Uncharacterized protein n=1 Tax=Brassica campestris TaxID=3711 RepID=A0A397YVW6_BRACM|nr:hypothetical protein BRARA_G03380 [Brassica rapa]
MCLMALSDAVLGNHATIYVGVIIVIKLYGLVSGTSFSAKFIFVVSVTAVGVLFGVALAWDVSRYNRVSVEDLSHCHSHDGGGICKGGICWHGVSVRSPVSQVRFSLPQHVPYGAI